MPLNVTPTANFNSAFVVEPTYGEPFVLLSRTDENNIAILNTEQAVATLAIVYRTKPVTVSDSGGRARRIRAKRVYVYGEGSISDGTIYFFADGGVKSENYSALTALPPIAQQEDCLLFQECTAFMTGYAIDVMLVLNGTGVVIRDARIEVTAID